MGYKPNRRPREGIKRHHRCNPPGWSCRRPITKKHPFESEIINNTGIKKCMIILTEKASISLYSISTCSNYGLISENKQADENFPLNPLSLYAKAKVSMKSICWQKRGKWIIPG